MLTTGPFKHRGLQYLLPSRHQVVVSIALLAGNTLSSVEKQLLS